MKATNPAHWSGYLRRWGGHSCLPWTFLSTFFLAIVFVSSAFAAATTRPATSTHIVATSLPVPLYPTSQRPPTTAPAVKIPGPFLPPPDARLRPRPVALPAIPEPVALAVELPPLLTVANPQTPRLSAHRGLAIAPVPFPALALPSPPVTSATGASSAASAINMPPAMRADGSGFFPMLPPLTRPTEAAEPDPLDSATLSPTAIPDEDAPIRALPTPPRPAMPVTK